MTLRVTSAPSRAELELAASFGGPASSAGGSSAPSVSPSAPPLPAAAAASSSMPTMPSFHASSDAPPPAMPTLHSQYSASSLSLSQSVPHQLEEERSGAQASPSVSATASRRPSENGQEGDAPSVSSRGEQPVFVPAHEVAEPVRAHAVPLPLPPIDPATQPIPGCKYHWSGIDCVFVQANGYRVFTAPFFGARVAPTYVAINDPNQEVLFHLADLASFLNQPVPFLEDALSSRATPFDGVYRARYFMDPPNGEASFAGQRIWGSYLLTIPAAQSLAESLGHVVALPVAAPASVYPALQVKPDPEEWVDDPESVDRVAEGGGAAAAAAASAVEVDEPVSTKRCECLSIGDLVWWALVTIYAPFYILASILVAFVWSLVLAFFYALPLGCVVVNNFCEVSWLGGAIGTILATTIMLLVIVPLSLIPALVVVLWIGFVSMPVAAVIISLRTSASVVYHGSFGRCFKQQISDMRAMQTRVDEWCADKPDGLGLHGFELEEWMYSDVWQLVPLAWHHGGLQAIRPREGVVPVPPPQPPVEQDEPVLHVRFHV